MGFLAALAADTPPEARAQAWEDLAEVMPGPAEMNAVLGTMVHVAGGMMEAATGRSSTAGVYSFVVATPFGDVPVDQAPPSVRWIGRWLTAHLNGDFATGAAVWFSDVESEADAKHTMSQFTGVVLGFLTTAVQAFLAAGNPFPADFKQRAEAWR